MLHPLPNERFRCDFERRSSSPAKLLVSSLPLQARPFSVPRVIKKSNHALSTFRAAPPKALEDFEIVQRGLAFRSRIDRVFSGCGQRETPVLLVPRPSITLKVEVVRLLQSALVTLLIGAGFLSQPPQSYRVESEPVADGTELVTFFGRLHNAASGSQDLRSEEIDVPLVAVLRDSLGDGDPANDRLRYVWILTSTQPTPWQRAASALSFGFFRAGSKRHANRVPSPALDLASPSRSVYSNLFSDGLQALEFDPLGRAIRSTTRTYRGNSSDYGKLEVFQALATLDNLDRDPTNVSVLPDSQFREIYSRLSLSTHTFGGLVRERQLSKYYDKRTSQLQQTRGHNWDLLRQRAELNGLIFEPLALASGTPSEALLWIARSDLDARAERHFDGQFLGIADPWTDDRLMHWTGYTQLRYFDSDHQPVPAWTPGARAEELIPLALYNLDYPQVPLLLADFRDSLHPKRREMLSQGAASMVTGVLGLTRFGNPEFFAADAAFAFVRGRHGAAVNRSARLEAYSEAREFLSVDSSLDPALKMELQHQLDHLALNPRENDVSHEANLAREQYAALLRYAESPRGAAKIERDRRKELEAYTHPRGERFFVALGRVFTRGPHVDPEKPDPILHARLDAYRRTAYNIRFLDQILASSPSPDVVWDAGAISRSVSALTSDTIADPKTQRIVSQVCARSTDADLVLTCLRATQAHAATAQPSDASAPIALGQ